MWNVGTCAKDNKFVLEAKFQSLAKKKKKKGWLKLEVNFAKSYGTKLKGKGRKIEIKSAPGFLGVMMLQTV